MTFRREKIKDYFLLDTSVENLFINEYMAAAPGDFVKVYLFAQMYADLGQEITNEAVSYTHLFYRISADPDLRHHQFSERHDDQQRKPEPCAKSPVHDRRQMQILRMSPVSYTHLDVYKRQQLHL